MNDHTHCSRCILSNCKNNSDCVVVPCEVKCGCQMHKCKLLEHRTVCLNRRVPCINEHYGCPMEVLRSQMSSHLKECPASVILCTMEWGRYPLYSEERLKWVPFPQRNPVLTKGCLDVELAVRDQRVITASRCHDNRRGVHKKLPGRFDYQSRPSYARAQKIKQEISKMKGANLVQSVREKLLYHNKSVENNNFTMVPDSGEPDGYDIQQTPPIAPKISEAHCAVGININLETIPTFLKCKYMYRVPCGQLLHRREFSGHFKNIHSDIHGSMGWMEQRCPLAQYGCTFIRHQLYPVNQQSSVVFSQHQGTFGIKSVENGRPTTDICYLLYLPCELMEYICSWLDNFSIRNLLCTCKALRQSSLLMLPKRGIVALNWKKRVYEDGSTSWKVQNKCWSFTSGFSEVHNWVHSDSPTMSAHLEHCEYYEKQRPSISFNYGPVLETTDKQCDNSE